jgi:hypothetical protein
MGGAVGNVFKALTPVLSLIPGIGPAIAGISALVQNVGNFAQAMRQGNPQEAARQAERTAQTAQAARNDVQAAQNRLQAAQGPAGGGFVNGITQGIQQAVQNVNGIIGGLGGVLNAFRA